PCAETYRGPMRASEPETQAFQAHFAEVMLDQNGPNGDDELPPAAPDDATGIFISLHSYQDEILWPYGFAEGGAPNNAQLKTIGRKLAYYNGSYPSGFLYTVDGSTDDWTYGKFGVASFTFEVGPTWGTCGGFFPPYGCIDGIDGMPRDFWTENRPAFLYAHKIARTPYMTSYGPDTLDVAVTPDDVPQGTPVALTATIADHRYGADPLRPIAAAEYFLNAPGADGTGIPLDPADGDWGDFTEVVEATVDTSSLAPGKHLILVHGKNDQGKWGPFSAVFVTITAGLSPEEMTLVASPLEIPIGDGEATITATLTLSDSTPIPGWVVTFTTDLGTVDPLTATSDLNGQAVTILSAGAITGTAQVTAEAAGLTESVAVEFYLPEPSVAGFTTNSPVCLCEATWFTFGGDEGRPPANEYAWWFGDGESTTVPTPDPVEHTYAAADIYSATLEVCQPGGACDSFSDWVDVRTGPVASFDYLAEGLTVTFTNSSTDADDYEWDLGDGNTSEEEHPVHVYDQGGCYTVTLTVSNMCGMDSQSEFICVCEPVGDVDFTWAPDPGMVGEPMLFTASEVSGTAPLTYTWDLGDETEMGTGITVTHVYTAEGVYAVTLWVENCGGEYQATKQHLVTVEAGILQLYVPVLLKNLGLPRLTANHQGQPISLLALLGAPSMRVGWRAQIPFES
ncbi:MAG: PKD domain-containing protein, partial [Anaerolineae bacterium]